MFRRYWFAVPSQFMLKSSSRNARPPAHSWSCSCPLIPGYRQLSSSSFPEVVIDKKDFGKITFRQMLVSDLNSVNQFITTRNLVDFSESDIYSVLESPDFNGIVALTEAHEIIACTGLLMNSKGVCSGGHHFIAEKCRRMALGSNIFQYAYELLGDAVTMFSYGFEELESYYDQTGLYFDKTFGRFHRLLGKFDDAYIHEKIDHDVEIVDVGKDNIHKVSLYDEHIQTAPRHQILHKMCFHPTTKTYAAMNVDNVRGFAMLKKCYGTYKIAPLYADNISIARLLFQRAAFDIPADSRVTMIITPNNDFADDFLKRNRFNVFNTMLRQSSKKEKIPFCIDFSKVFTLTDSHFALC